MTRTWKGPLVLAALVCASSPALAARTFCDAFRPQAKPDWANQRGNWRSGQKQYDATNPANNPVTYTDLSTYPALNDFTVWVNVNNLNDGGVWLRSNYNGGAVNGVLLVTGGVFGTFNGFYWHVFQNGVASPQLNPVTVPGIQGTNVSLKIVVHKSTYKLYMAGSTTPLTTLTDPTFSSGSVGLYDFSPNSGAATPRGETFSNFCFSVTK